MGVGMDRRTHPTLVNGIDKRDEPSGQISLVQVHPWYIGDDERVVVPDQFEIVRCAGSATDELVEGEFRGLAAREGDLDLATPDFLRGRVRRVVDRVAQEVEPLLSVALSVGAQGVVVHGGWGAGDLSVVGRGVQIDHFESGLEELDAGDEGLALDAVLIKVVGVAVGCGDENDAVGHE